MMTLQTPWSVVRNKIDKVFPWSIRDADATEVARFNDHVEAKAIVALVNTHLSTTPGDDFDRGMHVGGGIA